MHTEIPRDQWESFCRSFGRQHRHWLITLGELPSELAQTSEPPLERPPAHLVARLQPLQNLRLERGPTLLLVIRCGEAEEQLFHVVRAPERVFLDQTANGAHRGLRIDGEGRRSTVLRFRAAAAPEAVDGVRP